MLGPFKSGGPFSLHQSFISNFRCIRTAMTSAAQNLHDFVVQDVAGEPVKLDKYRGNVVIVINVASECGLAKNNYLQLKEIQDKYYQKGLRVAAFPCNQFAEQEPACSIDVVKHVKDTFNYEPDMYGKIDVNGAKADPLFEWLKHEKAGMLFDDIKWNFTKFLINRKGEVTNRYAPTSEPATFVEDVEKLLNEKA